MGKLSLNSNRLTHHSRGARRANALERAFSQRGRRVRVAAGERLFHQGDDSSCLFWLERGVVWLAEHQASGEFVSRWVTAPCLLGEEDCLLNQSRHEEATALIDTEGWAFSSADLPWLLSDPQRAIDWANELAVRNMQQRSTQDSSKTSLEKVVNLLEAMTTESAMGRQTLSQARPLPSVSQENIASILGLSRRTVARVFVILRENQVLRGEKGRGVCFFPHQLSDLVAKSFDEFD